MSLLSHELLGVIDDYKQLIKKRLPKTKRIEKLGHMQLSQSQLPTDNMGLYKKVQAIIADIDQTIRDENSKQSYYAYSGLEKFREHIQIKLKQIFIDGDHIVHKTQKAAAAIIQAVQLAALPDSLLQDNIKKALCQCNAAIAEFGSTEQQQNYRRCIEKQVARNAAFFTDVLNHLDHEFDEKVGERPITVKLFSDEDDI